MQVHKIREGSFAINIERGFGGQTYIPLSPLTHNISLNVPHQPCHLHTYTLPPPPFTSWSHPPDLTFERHLPPSPPGWSRNLISIHTVNNPSLLLCTYITSPDDELRQQHNNSLINFYILKAPKSIPFELAHFTFQHGSHQVQ